MTTSPGRWQTIKRLFWAALEEEPAQRVSFLRNNCSDSDVCFEVERLLTEHEQSGSFLAEPALENLGIEDEEVPPSHRLSEGDFIAGRFRIVKFIAAGGMGEVYKAKDTKLGRTIALKVVSSEIAEDRESLKRFRREAKAASALNHPNICTVFDFLEDGGRAFIAMEFLEGESLTARLKRGRCSLAESLKIAIDVSSALSAAHTLGIIHRDLKPGNVMLTDAGAKLLDFGLAKRNHPVVDEQASASTLSVSEELSFAGTLPYMPPEQLRGEGVDQRADIFAFGAILYEMLSGQGAFERASWLETANAILKEETPEFPIDTKQGVPPTMERMVRRCLEKNRENRYQSAKDLWFTLGDISPNGGGVEIQAVHLSRKLGRIGQYAILVTSAGLIAGILGFSWGRLFKAPQATYERVTFRKGAISAARFSPDEHTIIYSAAWGSPTSKLYRTNADGTDVRALDLPLSDLLAVSRSGELAISEAESPTRLAQAPLNGGAPRELLDNVTKADWSRDGTQLAIVRTENGKCRLEYPAGNILYETIGFITHMRISPQGDAIAFMDHPLNGDDRGTVSMVDLKGRKRTLTGEWEGEQGLAWSPDGAEVWFTATKTRDWDRQLYAVTRSGKLRLVLNIPGALYLEDIASDGRVLFRREDRRFEVAGGTIGAGTSLISWAEIMEAASISRDGKYALLTDFSAVGDYDVYLAKLDGSPPVQLGKGTASDISPDDKWATSILPSDTNRVLILPTGIGSTKSITAPNFHYRAAVWTSDGRKLVVLASGSDRPLRYWVQGLDGGSPRALTPEGIDGLFVTVNHSDYLSARDSSGAVRLYPIDGGEPKLVPDLAPSDEVIGGSTDSEAVYVSHKPSATQQTIAKVNLAMGRRETLLNIAPTDPAGVVYVFGPRFSNDGKRFVYNQIRELSVLYVVKGLK